MDVAMLKSALTIILTPSPAVFIIGIAIVLLIPVAVHQWLSRSTPYTTLPAVLIAGPSGGGKTALQTLLERGPLRRAAGDPPASAARTHTSQQPAGVELAVSEDRTSSFRDDLDASGSAAKKFLLVDTPGHGKLRAQHALASLAPAASSRLQAVVFVVDAADPDGLPAAAEFLYDVLAALQRRTGATKSSRAPRAVSVLVAANKMDLFTALPAALVRSGLENELGRIRSTRSRALLDSSVGADDVGAGVEETDAWLGTPGTEKFSFGQMREYDIEVDVVGGNVLGEGPGVDKWWKWIVDRI